MYCSRFSWHSSLPSSSSVPAAYMLQSHLRSALDCCNTSVVQSATLSLLNILFISNPDLTEFLFGSFKKSTLENCLPHIWASLLSAFGELHHLSCTHLLRGAIPRNTCLTFFSPMDLETLPVCLLADARPCILIRGSSNQQTTQLTFIDSLQSFTSLSINLSGFYVQRFSLLFWSKTPPYENPQGVSNLMTKDNMSVQSFKKTPGGRLIRMY